MNGIDISVLSEELTRLKEENATLCARIEAAEERAKDRDRAARVLASDNATLRASLTQAEGVNKALRETLKNLLFAHECADETGYVDDVGFMDVDAILKTAHELTDGASTPPIVGQTESREAALTAALSTSHEAIKESWYEGYHAYGGNKQKENQSRARVLKWEAVRDAALSATPPSVGREDWQPIATAPKGRKVIAGYYNVLGKWRSVMACYYLPGTLPATDDWIADGEYAPEGWYEESEAYCENLLQMDCQPTHWQPLPHPPRPALNSN